MSYKSQHLEESISERDIRAFVTKNLSLVDEYTMKEIYTELVATKLNNLKTYGSFSSNNRRMEIFSGITGKTYSLNDFSYEDLVREMEKFAGSMDTEALEIKKEFSSYYDSFFKYGVLKLGNKSEFKISFHVGTIIDLFTVLSYAIKKDANRLNADALVKKYSIGDFQSNIHEQKNIAELGIVVKRLKNGKVLVGGLKSDAIARLKKMSEVLIGR